MVGGRVDHIHLLRRVLAVVHLHPEMVGAALQVAEVGDKAGLLAVQVGVVGNVVINRFDAGKHGDYLGAGDAVGVGVGDALAKGAGVGEVAQLGRLVGREHLPAHMDGAQVGAIFQVGFEQLCRRRVGDGGQRQARVGEIADEIDLPVAHLGAAHIVDRADVGRPNVIDRADLADAVGAVAQLVEELGADLTR